MADITREDVATLIAETYASDVLQAAVAGSTALQAFPNTINMGTKVHNMPVLATLPEAQWVSESATDTAGAKPTSKATWGNKQLIAEEIAVIVPVHENVVDDATEDILAQIAALGGQAIGKTLDQAVIFGTNKPASWTSPDLVTAATAAGNVQQVGTGENDLGGSFLKAAGLVAAGANPDIALATLALRYRLANLRDATGAPIFLPTIGAPIGEGQIAGITSVLNRNGAWDAAKSEGVVVDSSMVKIGVRQDVTVKFLDQATVGGINLAERDMVALRFKARYAYVLGDIIGSDGQPHTPVANVTPAAAVTG